MIVKIVLTFLHVFKMTYLLEINILTYCSPIYLEITFISQYRQYYEHQTYVHKSLEYIPFKINTLAYLHFVYRVYSFVQNDCSETFS